jgi:uncharacterized membrane protein YeaQ/YmgE (transglycosylase-associated protein family)
MLLDLLLFLGIGLLAGYLAGVLLRGRGLGWRADLVIGVLGALLGGFATPLLGLSAHGPIGRLVQAVIGAVVVLLLVGFAFRGRRASRA